MTPASNDTDRNRRIEESHAANQDDLRRLVEGLNPERNAVFALTSGRCATALSDEQLLQRIAQNQPGARDAMFRRYGVVAYRVAHRVLGNDADACDAVQEAFLQVFRKLQGFQGRSSFKTWLLTIVENAAQKLLRQRKSRDRLLERLQRNEKLVAVYWAAEQRTPPDAMIEREEEDNLKALYNAILLILESDPPIWITQVRWDRMQRVLWKRIKGDTYEQIAEKLGWCEKTVRTDIHCLREHILRELAARRYSVR